MASGHRRLATEATGLAFALRSDSSYRMVSDRAFCREEEVSDRPLSGAEEVFAQIQALDMLAHMVVAWVAERDPAFVEQALKALDDAPPYPPNAGQASNPELALRIRDRAQELLRQKLLTFSQAGPQP